ncbi:affinity nitrate transporter 2 [Seminavis robusta]|uniref:Affinity nitrate transporter 2 n=1 Tax=Seminavis robusta TaxID=568900 RepID=A0A9N8HRW4_9STRA|nr:affinity nitrate transporter 2 [Seminavis robusta]|eukprot:Sro1320_g262360.1 affinity nitrate transporter 2 (1205) ;mRNA; r:3104-7003
MPPPPADSLQQEEESLSVFKSAHSTHSISNDSTGSEDRSTAMTTVLTEPDLYPEALATALKLPAAATSKFAAAMETTGTTADNNHHQPPEERLSLNMAVYQEAEKKQAEKQQIQAEPEVKPTLSITGPIPIGQINSLRMEASEQALADQEQLASSSSGHEPQDTSDNAPNIIPEEHPFESDLEEAQATAADTIDPLTSTSDASEIIIHQAARDQELTDRELTDEESTPPQKQSTVVSQIAYSVSKAISSGSHASSKNHSSDDNQFSVSSWRRRQLAPHPPSSDQRTVSSNRTPTRTRKRRVRFSHVGIRNYKTTIGDNPCCSYGPPLSLDWEYCEEDEEGYYLGRVPIDYYEASKPYSGIKAPSQRRKVAMLVLNPTQRCARLFQAGYSMQDMKNAADRLQRDKFRGGNVGGLLDPFHWLQELWLFQIKPVVMKRYNENQEEELQRKMERELRKIERKVRDEHESQSLGMSQQSIAMMSDVNDEISDQFIVLDLEEEVVVDLERGGGNNTNNNHDSTSNPSINVSSTASSGRHQVIIENLDGLSKTSRHSSKHSLSRFSSSRQSEISSTGSHQDEDGRMGDDSKSTSTSTYGLNVDRKQHDKAIEIKLSSFKRPHMRAFHASWFSFFVAFFLWFSITPLLSEVRTTLDLTDAEIWTSSLMGTLGTIVMRIVMGPLCDTFGARLCMATVLIAAAIPTALTGLVQTSAGLSLVRLFIGFGGSSFVACQYWTSDMFARNVAGAANALAAGWGNLGGGVAQLLMGSVLFPLLQFIYSGADDEFDGVASDNDQKRSTELAWRTIFVFPALLALVIGCLIIFYCDDAPLGNYRELIKSERLMVATPMESLCSTAKRGQNVWILAIQYACCFGIEVTMTNATALYFKDVFGQSTVQAAAISSVFGMMNLFARGLGGWCSDYLQRVAGIRGRLAWQVFTLAVEGVMVCIFAHAQSLAGSIIVLVFLSCMVQSAEGSTFGIVPYVERRFTGSVVGIVGSGGSIGAAIFSIFFVYGDYRPAFFFMGVCAVGSSLLTFCLNTRKIKKMQDFLTQEVEREEGDGDLDDEEEDVDFYEDPQQSSERETLATTDADEPMERDQLVRTDADEPIQRDTLVTTGFIERDPDVDDEPNQREALPTAGDVELNLRDKLSATDSNERDTLESKEGNEPDEQEARPSTETVKANARDTVVTTKADEPSQRDTIVTTDADEPTEQ